jgi:hypothetical protein
VRQLFPEPINPVEPAEVSADLRRADGRPAVRLNGITRVDGAASANGLPGKVGGAADRRVFMSLRSVTDEKATR